jgi:uncharacterized protein (TIGR00730 family)
MNDNNHLMPLPSICVFCGSQSGSDPAYVEAARKLGTLLAATGRQLVYGGGHVGIMGAIADSALAGSGRVVGVIPQTLVDREAAHRGLSDLRVVASMHDRKSLMSELSDAFMVLPGGIGTMEEFFEVWTWGTLGLHTKPYGLLNTAGYFDPLIGFLDSAVELGFVKTEHRELLMVDETAEGLIEQMAQRVLPSLPQWIDRETT